MKNKIVLTEQDMINTYDARQQEQCGLYHTYIKIKEENPSFGYKKIAKLLNQSYGKTRWWHAKKHIPVPIQTANWLKEKGLIPLTIEDSRVQLISKILGATFGDGGIFGNLNGIFLSSSELEAVKEFGEDLKTIFGSEIESNSRIIEAGGYGHSWCYQNTNRNVIRLFQALGAPIGRKSQIEFKIPEWIFINEKIADSFFSSFLGGELGTPTIHKNNNQLTSLDIGLQTTINSRENKINFLSQIQKYLNSKNIRTGSISISYPKKYPDKCLLRLQISKDLDNFYNFVQMIRLTYCKYKQERLNNTLKDFINLKYHRYRDVLFNTKNKETTLRVLNLTPHSLEIIKQQRKDV
ncbi:hypothetical protein HYT57_02325 [Candidatus Woesearchaeota archaeon]|nr:hypothetical protein [Candidatus Woesearchaeota archaeon]